MIRFRFSITVSNLFQNTKLENNQHNQIKQKLSFMKYIVSVERLC